MPSWVAIDVALGDNAKVWRFASEVLRLPAKYAHLAVPAVVGHLTMLFGAIKVNAPSGDIGAVPDALLEMWAKWRGTPGAFAPHFRATFAPTGTVNDWEEWNGHLLRKQEAERERWKRRKSRGDSAESPRSDDGISAGDSAETPAPTLPYPTLPETTPAAATAACARARAHAVERFPEVANALSPDGERDYLAELLVSVPDPSAYLAVLAESLRGDAGAARNPSELASAVRDWVANGERPGLRRFRGYLRAARAAPATAPANGYRTAGEDVATRAFRTTLRALEDMP